MRKKAVLYSSAGWLKEGIDKSSVNLTLSGLVKGEQKQREKVTSKVTGGTQLSEEAKANH